MVYKLNVTDHADELLDNLVYHLIYRLKNKEAAKHLLDSVESDIIHLWNNRLIISFFCQIHIPTFRKLVWILHQSVI